MRNFVAHNSQLTSIAVRPAYSGPYFDPTPRPVAYRRKEAASSSKKTHNQQLYQFAQDDINMGSANDNDGNSLFGDDPPDERDDTKAPVPVPGDATSLDPGSQPTNGNTTQPTASAFPGEDDDVKSEGSVADSLFGDDGDESESNGNTNTNPLPTPAPIYQAPPPPPGQNPYLSTLAVPGSVQPGSTNPQYVFPVAGQQQGQQPYYSTQTFSVQLNPQQQQQQAVMQYQQPLPPVQAPQPPPPKPVAKVVAPKPPPKNAPPLLDSSSYSNFSSDLLMTAFVDGQVVLWDRRVSTPGQGVGRLWMSEKTPPWCLSVRRSSSQRYMQRG